MATVRAVLEALERIAPRRFAFSSDKIGLQLGEVDAPVKRAVVSLDRSLAAVQHAEEVDAQLLVSHHPLIFQPLSSLTDQSHVGRTALRLARSWIAFIAAHTNWDAAQGGVNDTLGRLLGLKDLRPFGEAAESPQLKLVFFCPEDAVDEVLDAVSGQGAGQIGLYSRCAFMSRGTGTFKGEEGSRPTIGEAGRIEKAEEMRVEMVLPSAQREPVADALRGAHPYEEPAFDFFTLDGGEGMPIGRIGMLATPVSLSGFVRDVDKALNTRSWAWGSPDRNVRRVAVVGGAADDEWREAQAAGADVLVTGEVKQHVALEAAESGFALVAAGHYATEHPGAVELASRLRTSVPDVDWRVFEPAPGAAGRPLS